MTRGKAIELLANIQFQEDDPNTPDIKNALKLAIADMQAIEESMGGD